MNQFIPHRIKDTPGHLFSSRGQHRIGIHLQETVSDAVKLKQQLEPYVRRQLSWRYGMLAHLIENNILSSHDRNQIISEPWQALNVVAERPCLYPIFKDLILSSHETVEQLCYFTRVTNEHIDGVDLAELHEILKYDPNRYLSALAAYSREQFMVARAEIVASVEAKKLDSPAWAFAWVERNQVLDDEPLEHDIAMTLMQDEYYSYRAMLSLRNRQMSSIVWESLETAIKTPRWCYHVLRDDLMTVHTKQAIDLLCTHPAWMVELMVDREFNRSFVRSCYQRCVSLAYEHELMADLHYWYRAGFEARMLPQLTASRTSA